MRVILSLLFLISIVAAPGTGVQTTRPQSASGAKTIMGRWRIKFTLVGGTEKNLVFEARENSAGLFRLLDTGLDDRPVPAPQPAVWSLTDNYLSVSSEVELQVGTCCRQTGTLIFKGRFSEGKPFSGQLIFVTNVAEEESPYKFHAAIGVFSATRVS